MLGVQKFYTRELTVTVVAFSCQTAIGLFLEQADTDRTLFIFYMNLRLTVIIYYIIEDICKALFVITFCSIY